MFMVINFMQNYICVGLVGSSDDIIGIVFLVLLQLFLVLLLGYYYRCEESGLLSPLIKPVSINSMWTRIYVER